MLPEWLKLLEFSPFPAMLGCPMFSSGPLLVYLVQRCPAPLEILSFWCPWQSYSHCTGLSDLSILNVMAVPVSVHPPQSCKCHLATTYSILIDILPNPMLYCCNNISRPLFASGSHYVAMTCVLRVLKRPQTAFRGWQTSKERRAQLARSLRSTLCRARVGIYFQALCHSCFRSTKVRRGIGVLC